LSKVLPVVPPLPFPPFLFPSFIYLFLPSSLSSRRVKQPAIYLNVVFALEQQGLHDASQQKVLRLNIDASSLFRYPPIPSFLSVRRGGQGGNESAEDLNTSMSSLYLSSGPP